MGVSNPFDTFDKFTFDKKIDKKKHKEQIINFSDEEYLMDDCRKLSKDFVKCEYCEFRFKCYTRRAE